MERRSRALQQSKVGLQMEEIVDVSLAVVCFTFSLPYTARDVGPAPANPSVRDHLHSGLHARWSLYARLGRRPSDQATSSHPDKFQPVIETSRPSGSDNIHHWTLLGLWARPCRYSGALHLLHSGEGKPTSSTLSSVSIHTAADSCDKRPSVP